MGERRDRDRERKTESLWFLKNTLKTSQFIADLCRVQNTFESVLMRWMKLEPIIQSQKENTDTVYERVYMEFRKMVMITLYARQQKRHRYIEQSFGLCGRRQGWDDLRE